MILNNFHQIFVKSWYIVVITNHKMGTTYTLAQILFIRVSSCHFPFFVFQECFKSDLICFRVSQNDPFVAKVWIGIYSKEKKVIIFAKGINFTGCSDTFDHGISAGLDCFMVELIRDIRGRILGSQFISQSNVSISILRHSSFNSLFDQELSNREVFKVKLIHQIIHNSTFSGSDCTCNTNNHHIKI